MSDVFSIVVTGGPCSGKTTFLAAAKQWLESRGCLVAVVPEIATEFITAGIDPLAPWSGPRDFQIMVFRYAMDRRRTYMEAMRRIQTTKPKVLLFDRAELDARGVYISVEDFDYIAEELEEISVAVLRDLYHGVIHLVTAADGAAEHYTLANNAARRETPDEAVALDQKSQAAWNGHRHRALIDNRTDFAGKQRRALQALTRIIAMPEKEPLEIERKWRITSYEPFVPVGRDVVRAAITQTYLKPYEQLTSERRVRRRVVDGVASYYYTEKDKTEISATRIERERQITEAEYWRFIAEESDRDRAPIEKTRYTFTYEGHFLELDVFHGRWRGLAFVEAEVTDLAETVLLPPEWEVEEVTDDPRFKNAALAAWPASSKAAEALGARRGISGKELIEQGLERMKKSGPRPLDAPTVDDGDDDWWPG